MADKPSLPGKVAKQLAARVWEVLFLGNNVSHFSSRQGHFYYNFINNIMELPFKERNLLYKKILLTLY